MQVCRDIPALRAALSAARRAGKRIGFVPTMGALHRGHQALIDAARENGDFIVVSIFVNPTQFAPNEDFSRYPRDEAGDLAMCRKAGVAVAFVPPVEVIYPNGAMTTVHVAKLTDTLCGPFRPGHFDGVATIVSKLFNIVQPDRAYFGQKDAQQLAIIRRMVSDLDFPIEIIGCPTVREEDGLALSSRNRYLSPAERAQAACVPRALLAAQEAAQAGETHASAVVEKMRRIIEAAGPVRIDYIALVDPDALHIVDRINGPVLAALAVRIGTTRLIDNMLIGPRKQNGGARTQG